MTKRVKNVISGAIMLTIAGLLSKILSALYRIPLQNLSGDLGFYAYQQIYPLIASVMILSLYGFPIAISKWISQEELVGKQSYRQILRPIFITLFVISAGIALLLYLFAPAIARLIQDEHLIVPLRLSSFLFLLLPFVSLYRGFFQAQLQMKYTAYSQVIEQVIRVGLILFGALLIYRQRIDVHHIATVGVVASMVAMLVISLLLGYYFHRQASFAAQERLLYSRSGWPIYLRAIVLSGLLTSLHHLTLVLIQLIDVFTLVPQLIKSGLSPLAAMEAKGIFDRGIPLIQFGAVLGSSFALALVPTIGRQSAVERKQSIQDALAVSVYIGAGATLGLWLLFPEVNRLLFLDAQGTSVLQCLSLSIICLSIAITASVILQAYGYVTWSLVSLTISLMLKLGLNLLLVASWETLGSALATVTSLVCLTLLSLAGLKRKLGFSIWSSIRLPALISAALGMWLYLGLMKWFLGMEGLSRWPLLAHVLFLVLTGALVYLVILLIYDALDERQLRALPFGDKWIQLQALIKQGIRMKKKGGN